MNIHRIPRELHPHWDPKYPLCLAQSTLPRSVPLLQKRLEEFLVPHRANLLHQVLHRFDRHRRIVIRLVVVGSRRVMLNAPVLAVLLEFLALELETVVTCQPVRCPDSGAPRKKPQHHILS